MKLFLKANENDASDIIDIFNYYLVFFFFFCKTNTLYFFNDSSFCLQTHVYLFNISCKVFFSFAMLHSFTNMCRGFDSIMNVFPALAMLL